MTISADAVKELRQKTGVGFMECKSALQEAGGDVEAAVAILRKRGVASVARKEGRETKEGLIGAYVHNGKIGALVEVNCETDFVARNADFQALVKDIAMQVAASDPLFVRRGEVPEEVVRAEREKYRDETRSTGQPEKVQEKIVDGRMEKFYAETCLLEQPFIRSADITVQDHLAGYIQKIGENIQVRRLARFKVGE
jgi:elongation factor Ts